MKRNHCERANHAEHARQDTGRAETSPAPADDGADTAANRLRSHTGSAVVVSLEAIAQRLRALRSVPEDVLRSEVTERGACMSMSPDGDPPRELFEDGTDRDIAARLCAGCPVIDACTEWEMRLAGPDTVGVWGGLNERDRRALYPLWLHHRATGDADRRAEGGGR